jgi:hypothetical protein
MDAWTCWEMQKGYVLYFRAVAECDLPGLL